MNYATKMIRSAVAFGCLAFCATFVCVAVFNLGCTSATNTAYQAEAVGYVTLQGCATGYKAYKTTHAVDAATDAKAHSLFAMSRF